jgi:RNA polymerase sigma-70 factor (ECF subfamily)
LRVIAERRTIDLLRQLRRHGTRELYLPPAFDAYPDENADPARSIDHAETSGRVTEALATLPQRQREAVEALVLKEQSLTETAVATGRTKVALKVNLHRALRALRGKMQRTE